VDTAIGGYRTETIPSSRVLAIDTLEEGIKRHHVTALIEPDVTDVRAALRRLVSEGGRRLSFTAWLIKCIAQAASEQPEAHAVRRRKRLFIFDDVGVSLLIETELEGKMVPLPYVVRKTNEKSVEEISGEIDAFKQSRTSGGALVLGDERTARLSGFYVHLPHFLRSRIMKSVFRRPLTVKRMAGTIAVTSVGMFGKAGGWALTCGVLPLIFAIGGAPAARFVARLTELIESGYGLEAGTVGAPTH
jgi:hypothetical protein